MKGIYKVRLADGTFAPIDLRTSIEQVAGLTEKLAEKYNTSTAVEELNNRYTKEESNEKFAPVKSPSLTGEPKAPTAITSDNSKKIATTEYVQKNKALLEDDINKKNSIVNFNKEKKDVLLRVYPVGSIYMSINSTNPNNLFGGNWESLASGRMLIGQSGAYPNATEGGESAHVLTKAEIPSHSHSGTTAIKNLEGKFSSTINMSRGYYNGTGIVNLYSAGTSYIGGGGADSNWLRNYEIDASHNHTFTTSNTGDNEAHNNMPPYLAVYMWKRVG